MDTVHWKKLCTWFIFYCGLLWFGILCTWFIFHILLWFVVVWYIMHMVHIVLWFCILCAWFIFHCGLLWFGILCTWFILYCSLLWFGILCTWLIFYYSLLWFGILYTWFIFYSFFAQPFQPNPVELGQSYWPTASEAKLHGRILANILCKYTKNIYITKIKNTTRPDVYSMGYTESSAINALKLKI